MEAEEATLTTLEELAAFMQTLEVRENRNYETFYGAAQLCILDNIFWKTEARYADTPHKPQKGLKKYGGAAVEPCETRVPFNLNRPLDSSSKLYGMARFQGVIHLVPVHHDGFVNLRGENEKNYLRLPLWGPWKCDLKEIFLAGISLPIYSTRVPTLWSRIPFTGEDHPMELQFQLYHDATRYLNYRQLPNI